MKLRPWLAATLLLAACSNNSAAPAPSPSPTIAECGSFTSQAAGAGDLPAVNVECLQGEGKVRLSGLRGPMLIPVWASWCVPCSEEMPIMQAFHDAYGEKVPVLGLDLMDETSQAIAASVNWGVGLPSLEDPDGLLRADLGVTAPPTTLFIDAAGRIVHREFGAVTDLAELKRLVEQHLGVAL